jgi:3-hydroxyisobutyrate dehydrogenase-like beta-hydroxyacid dehydrogenase
MHIGMIGLGFMGRGMATHLLGKFGSLRIPDNRASDAVAALCEAGAMAVPVNALVVYSSHVVLCLSDGSQVHEILDQCAGDWHPGQWVIDATTQGVEESLAHRVRLKALGVRYVDAPVTRGPADANAGRLITLLGLEDASEGPEITDLVSAYSEQVHYFGGGSRALAAKLLNNYITCVTSSAIVDIADAARELEIDLAQLTTVLMGSAARSGTLEKMLVPATQGDFQGHRFSVKNAIKDLQLAAQLIPGENTNLANTAAVRLARRHHTQRTVLSELLKP